MQKTLGLIVNPVAGMGGSVGLKGTDGKDLFKKALDLGAEPVTPTRTKEFLNHIEHLDQVNFLVAPDQMGERFVKPLDIPFEVMGQLDEETSAEDTKRIAGKMVERGAELLIFVGGDGTARDIYDVVGSTIPVVAVPAGVKMYSSAFATNPRAAAELVDAFLEGAEGTEEEVLDIDEDAYRQDTLASRLYGYLTVPKVQRYLQPGKIASSVGAPAQMVKREIALYVIEEMDPETLYLLGPGTTVKAITDEMNLPKTLLGIDAVRDGKIVGEDLNEQGILELFDKYAKRSIIVTPIGGNGFIFGRGSKQFTPQVLKQVGRENITVVGTQQKVQSLDCLRVDTGDPELDHQLSGYQKVIVDYKRKKVVKVKC
jgi:predicted polyphosphate/ATP-dependent NAD kinase